MENKCEYFYKRVEYTRQTCGRYCSSGTGEEYSNFSGRMKAIMLRNLTHRLALKNFMHNNATSLGQMNKETRDGICDTPGSNEEYLQSFYW